jgi:hypothetical protein
MNVPALLATIVVVCLIDGGLLSLCIGLADTAGGGAMLFFVGGGPPTLIFSGHIYTRFKRRFAG